MTTIPTAQEILFLYLYGQKTPPYDLKSEGLNDADFIDRAYVFGSGNFKINEEA